MGTTLLTCGNELLTQNEIKKCQDNSSMSLPGLHSMALFPLFFTEYTNNIHLSCG